MVSRLNANNNVEITKVITEPTNVKGLEEKLIRSVKKSSVADMIQVQSHYVPKGKLMRGGLALVNRLSGVGILSSYIKIIMSKLIILIWLQTTQPTRGGAVTAVW